MLLVLDVGNTNTVLGVYAGGSSELLGQFRISTHPFGTSDELKQKTQFWLRDLGTSFAEVTRVVVSSVVPQVSSVILQAWPEVKFVDHRWKFSFSIGAEPAASVGSDRLVNAEAAVRDFGAPVILLDSGTATTLCAVASGAVYLGGAILPGIDGSLDALVRRAARLSPVELRAPEHAIGRNTTEAIQSGILLGYASMLDGMVARFRAELGLPNCRVIATGGVSARLQGLLKCGVQFDSDLTLRGLRYLAETL